MEKQEPLGQPDPKASKGHRVNLGSKGLQVKPPGRATKARPDPKGSRGHRAKEHAGHAVSRESLVHKARPVPKAVSRPQ